MNIKSRREIFARIRTQTNDCRCFRAGNDNDSSRKNKQAKRHSARILRQIIREEIRKELSLQIIPKAL
jgi:hypothetical protein